MKFPAQHPNLATEGHRSMELRYVLGGERVGHYISDLANSFLQNNQRLNYHCLLVVIYPNIIASHRMYGTFLHC